VLACSEIQDFQE